MKLNDKCDKCRKPCSETAGVEVRGQVKFYCYNCYRDHKARKELR